MHNGPSSREQPYEGRSGEAQSRPPHRTVRCTKVQTTYEPKSELDPEDLDGTNVHLLSSTVLDRPHHRRQFTTDMTISSCRIRLQSLQRELTAINSTIHPVNWNDVSF